MDEAPTNAAPGNAAAIGASVGGPRKGLSVVLDPGRDFPAARNLSISGQHARALEDRGWVRSRARDYYDLWRILDTYRDQLDIEDFPAFLAEKCAVRDVSFSGPGSFFPETMLAEVEKTWKQWLGPLVPELPPCKVVIEGLRSQVATLL